MIIETDQWNPIIVFNITDKSILHSVTISDTIFSAHFLDANNTLMIVFGLNATVIVNLTDSSQYPLPPIIASDFTTDRVGSNIFTCYNNVI